MKKFALLVMASVLSLSMGVTSVFANETVGYQNDTAIVIGETQVEEITLDQVPEDVAPLYFDTQEEADAYVENLLNNIKQENLDGAIQINPMARATYGTVAVDKYYIGSTGTLTLYIEYSTSGNGNTGSIVYANAYTQQTGWGLGTKWVESKPPTVSKTAKDAYAVCSGVIENYIFISGIGTLHRSPVNLQGWAYLVR